MGGRFGMFDGIDDLAGYSNTSPTELRSYPLRRGIPARDNRPTFNARSKTVPLTADLPRDPSRLV